ncbi:pitrilysin family protein [Streptomyces sp. RG80]|uniref:M16 family metallopeptidase n=1 Tax=Streptomyces sp. RG80 TaxID=3157340 RepID=UPI00338FB2B6
MRRLTLGNGLRVVLDPRPAALVVEVAVHYHAGFRSDPVGRSGLAHLFEHLMFQGSARVGPGEHHRLVNAAGGHANAATLQDHTEYYQGGPPSALERFLFLEADRMRGPRLTSEALRTQVDVVKAEIRLNVTDTATGGPVWTRLPGVLYSGFTNSHNGYGEFAELERVTLAECEAFFDRHYAPGDAVLTVTGRFDPARAAELIHRHFDGIPGRPGPTARDLTSETTVDRREHHTVPGAWSPSLHVGHQLPDASADLTPYADHVLLSRILTARLRAALVAPGHAVSAQARCGFFGPLLAHAPDTFVLSVTHGERTHPDEVLNTVADHLTALADEGPSPAELHHATTRAGIETWRRHDSFTTRVRLAGAFETLHGHAELVDDLPHLLAATTADGVARAAKRLHTEPRAVLALTPGAPSSPGAPGAPGGAS